MGQRHCRSCSDSGNRRNFRGYLLDYLAEGDSLDEFLHQFPTVKREQATALLSFAEELILARFGEASPR